jgi:hypothetical protein
MIFLFAISLSAVMAGLDPDIHDETQCTVTLNQHCR